MPVIVLAGEEEFEISRRIAELKSTLLVSPWHTINFIKLNNPDFATLAENSATLVLGKGKRIILVDDCQLFTKKRAKAENSKSSIDSSVEEEFAAVLATVSENTYLVFACFSNFDSTLRLS